jgi:hypothetical protein
MNFAVEVATLLGFIRFHRRAVMALLIYVERKLGRSRGWKRRSGRSGGWSHSLSRPPCCLKPLVFFEHRRDRSLRP